MNSRRAAPPELRKLLAVEISRLVRRDATISLRGQHYAVPPELMGKHVWVGLLGDEISIEHAGRTVATYSRWVFRFGAANVFTFGGHVTRH